MYTMRPNSKERSSLKQSPPPQRPEDGRWQAAVARGLPGVLLTASPALEQASRSLGNFSTPSPSSSAKERSAPATRRRRSGREDGRRSAALLLMASLGTGVGKQVSGKVLSSTALILRLHIGLSPRCPHLEKPNSNVQSLD